MVLDQKGGGFEAEAELRMARTIALSAYRAFQYAEAVGGGVVLPWDQLPEEAQNGWLRVVFVVHAVTEEADNVPWSHIAKTAYNVYAKAFHSVIEFDTLSPQTQLAWQAAVRHIVSIFAMTDDDDSDVTEEGLQEMETCWLSWTMRKLDELASSESVSGTNSPVV